MAELLSKAASQCNTAIDSAAFQTDEAVSQHKDLTALPRADVATRHSELDALLDESVLAPDAKTALFRILQEAVTNVTVTPMPHLSP